MLDNNHSVALLVRHPDLDPSEIAAALGLVPTFTQTARMPRTTPAGRKVSGTYSESYGCFYVATVNGLDAALRSVGDFMQRKSDVIGRWNGEKGRVSVSLSVSGNHAAVLVPSQLLGVCARLGVTIELSLHEAAQRQGLHADNAMDTT